MKFFSLALLALVPALLPAAAAAQSLEVGGWVARSFSSESTHGNTSCISPGDPACRARTAPPEGRTATAAALTLRWHRGGILGARGELALAPKGYASPAQPYVSSLYLEMPLLAEVSSEPVGPVSFFMAGGVAPAVLLRCTVSGMTESGPRQAECGDAGMAAGTGTRAFDLGGVYSGGLRLRNQGGSAYLEVRSVGGLIDTRPGHAGRTLNSTSAVIAGFTLTPPRRR